MRHFNYIRLFVILLAAVSAARPALAAVGTTENLEERLNNIVALIERSDARLDRLDASIESAANGVGQLERQLDAGADPTEIIQQLEFMLHRLDDFASSIRNIRLALSDARADVERIAMVAEKMGDRVLKAKARLVFHSLAATDAKAVTAAENVTKVRDDVFRVIEKARMK